LRQTYRLHAALPSMRCVGYRQVYAVLDGSAPRHELRERGIVATRQLAKRQITWLNNTLRPKMLNAPAGDLDDRLARLVEAFLV
jgi:tRNA dimethylallyltransferase